MLTTGNLGDFNGAGICVRNGNTVGHWLLLRIDHVFFRITNPKRDVIVNLTFHVTTTGTGISLEFL